MIGVHCRGAVGLRRTRRAACGVASAGPKRVNQPARVVCKIDARFEATRTCPTDVGGVLDIRPPQSYRYDPGVVRHRRAASASKGRCRPREPHHASVLKGVFDVMPQRGIAEAGGTNSGALSTSRSVLEVFQRSMSGAVAPDLQDR